MVHHINTTITPPRCGETKLRGDTAFYQYTFKYMKQSPHAFPLLNGTCASAGYTLPAGPQDLSTRQSWGTSRSSYRYTIKFFHKGLRAAPTVVGLAVAIPDLSMLVAALKAAGLVGALSAKGPFTVFAPTNYAFSKLKGAVPILLEPQNKALLIKVLEYHVLAGQRLYTDQIKEGMKVTTLEGQSIEFDTRYKDGVKVYKMGDNVAIDTANVNASNGVVHIIQKVLLFPGFALPAATMTPAVPAGKGGKGGTAPCKDDATFSDAYGTCLAYTANKWCANGEIGPAWQSTWGALTATTVKACCACGGGSLEAGH